MTETAITIEGNGAALAMIDTRRTPAAIVAQRNAIIECMQKTMKEGIDFGTIPGTDKPSLWKPGAEKICALFNLGAFPRVEDVSTPDTVRYRLYVLIKHVPTGVELGEGVGEASSAESKYQWRAAICQEEWDEFPEDRRRRKWKKGRDKPYVVWQVRADQEDVANTILKMAKKRSLVDAVLTCTAASDMFTQDIEDLKDAGLDPGEAGEDADKKSAANEELAKKTAAPRTQSSTQASTSTAAAGVGSGAACVTEAQAKRFWAVAIERTNDYKAILDYLRGVHGVQKKELIMQSRLAEAMTWAESGRVDD